MRTAAVCSNSEMSQMVGPNASMPEACVVCHESKDDGSDLRELYPCWNAEDGIEDSEMEKSGVDDGG